MDSVRLASKSVAGASMMPNTTWMYQLFSPCAGLFSNITASQLQLQQSIQLATKLNDRSNCHSGAFKLRIISLEEELADAVNQLPDSIPAPDALLFL